MDLAEVGLLQPDQHWYFLHKKRVLLKGLRSFNLKSASICDVGSGSGYFAKSIKQEWPRASILCVDTEFKDSELGIREGLSFVRERPAHLKFNLVLFMDVIEHVEDDRKLVSHYLEPLEDRGILIFTVPALMSLWSSHDVWLKHFRRYSRKDLINLAADLNLEILELRYLFTPVFPALYLLRKLLGLRRERNDLKPQNLLANRVLLAILKLDFLNITASFPGSSLLMIARPKLELK